MEVKRSALVPELPIEVWQRVSEHLTTREWVTSGGLVCKFLQRLQPLHMKLATKRLSGCFHLECSIRIVESIVRWMLHHWTNARAVDLMLLPPYEEHPVHITRLLDFIQDLKQGARAESHLPTALRLFKGSFISDFRVHIIIMAHACHTYHKEDYGPLSISEGPLEQLCERLLPLMSRLTALNLSVPLAPHLPPFIDYEHLELHCVRFDGVEQALIKLKSLQTLFLSCEHLDAKLRALRLKGLPKLRHVRMDDVFPAELSLPHGCRLDVHGEATVMDKEIGIGWQDALKHLHACTCRWTVKRDSLESKNVQDLPSFLSMAAGCIQELSLIGKQPKHHQLLRLSIRLDRAIFCNVTRFWLKSNSQLKIHIPAAVRLASLEIYADVLELFFEDAMTSCASLNNINLFFLAHYSRLSWLEQIMEYSAEGGLHIRQHTRQYEYTLVTSLPPSPNGHKYEVEKNMCFLEGALPSCTCTMCWACMGR